MKKILLLTLLISTVAFGKKYNDVNLTTDQVTKIVDIYQIGKTIEAKDGMTFENTLPSMFCQESSCGVYVLGDKYDKNGKLKSVYESSLGNFQIKLSTAKLTIRNNENLLKKYGYLLYEGKSVYIKFEKNKKKLDYYKSVLENPVWIERKEKGNKKAIKTIKWATKNYKKHLDVHHKLMSKAHKDTKLINKLFTDYKFGAEIAGHYLKDMYEEAIDRGFNNRYKRSVGRYNGGWNNMNYANKVVNWMNTIKVVVKKELKS